ncbi:signal peptide peptidase SppA [Thalassotalea sp. LPB0316]|uniref:signal peptide peptidase SppA n=1 Tax=Thalassotalea sp. LPB0316 TaxID=2769490 RepID=UPI0018688EA8|nr:signal peptide peptidase SppA [Thalassotalea sp. LPB0316]QOL24839.1 signal peptide peptidase SppA [Thalassotalea sp. LPB0316]
MAQFVKSLFLKLGYTLNLTRKIIINLIFFTLLFLIFKSLSTDDMVSVPKNGALVLDPRGQLVEQKVEVDPFDAIMGEAISGDKADPEVLLSNIIKVINNATHDPRIALLVLKLERLQSADITKMTEIAKAIEGFKASGKKVIAVGDGYSQGQYYLASFADEIWLNPNGWLILDGYARKQLYVKSALDKAGINQHIFRVGTYKSAVEPYMRDDMSEEAKEANRLWLNELWNAYKTTVAKQRGFDTDNFDETISDLVAKVELAQGNIAQYALNNRWVDKLMTREQMNKTLIEYVGDKTQASTFDHINFQDYLIATNQEQLPNYQQQDQIAMIVAKGAILNGNQPAGTIGGDSTAALLRKARLNDQVKAVVLRVDSPGGSAFASDVIRQEIELIKASGKPVVASMGTYAASGGYWISAAADKIVASPTTITGSIGIFGMFMTFEDTLSKFGVYTDGVGTTDYAGFGVTEALPEGIGQLIQLNINRGYQDFLTLVAENRNMTVEQADKVAQGRVWSGVQAKDLGLVDELGGIDESIALAAELAQLEQYELKLVEKELDPFSQMIQDLVGQTYAFMIEHEIIKPDTQPNYASILIKQFKSQLGYLTNFDDPNGIYSFCLTCEIN